MGLRRSRKRVEGFLESQRILHEEPSGGVPQAVTGLVDLGFN